MNSQSWRAWAVYGVCVWGFSFSLFYRVSTAVIAPHLAHDLNMGPVELGELSAAFFYAFAACQLPLGIALDRWGSRLPMAICSLTGAAGALFFALAQTSGQVILARVVLGIGMSSGLMGSLILIAAWFPADRFATLAGLLVALGTLGQLGAATPLALLAESLGWRGAFGVISVVNMGQAVVLFLVARDRPAHVPPPPRAGNPLKGLGRVLAMPAYWGISLGTFARYGCTVAVQGLWAGPFLMTGLGMTIIETGNALFVFALGMMIGLVLFGRMSDYWVGSRKKVIAPSLLAMCLGFLLLYFWSPIWGELLVYPFFFAMGMIVSTGQVMYAQMKELAPPGLSATSMTAINIFTMLGPATIMQTTGWLVGDKPIAPGDVGAFGPAWLFMAALCLISWVVYLMVPDSRPRTDSVRESAGR